MKTVEEGFFVRSRSTLADPIRIGVALGALFWPMVTLDASVHEDVPATAIPPRVDFNFDVKPILSRRCFSCHGFDPSTRKANLRLDIFEGATSARRRGAAIAPRHPNDSLLIDRITSDDPDYRMPPGHQPALSRAEIQTLRQWIEQGAEYAPHWSWVPLNPGAVPEILDDWCRDDIDHYVARKRAAAGLTTVAPEADRATWLRRVTFDITGLPPSVDELDAFLADHSPNAHVAVVDRLLASPDYAERWARHWLDLMRYAETYGHEFDYPIPHAHQYRDYVIRAFDIDLPYDQLVLEHIAGDLLETPRRNPEHGYNESIIGTGFWFLHQGTHAPTDVRQDEAERIDNQIDVLTKTFLAATVSCARCHDHKFDAIPTQDYYALMGFLQSSRQRELALYPDSSQQTFADLRRLSDTGRLALADISPREAGEQVARELRATHDAVYGEGYQPYVPREPIEFEDFEAEEYDGWTVEGTAFGIAPQHSDTLGTWHSVTGEQGQGFVNSHQARGLKNPNAAEADRQLGKMTSREFTIDLPRISLLICGGDHRGKTCVDLVIDDKVVRSVTGNRSNKMRNVHMDVREFVGKRARLQIVDDERGGWGHIGVDHIVFEDSRPRLSTARDLAAVGREHGVDPQRIERWIDFLDSEEIRKNDHPFHPWFLGVIRPEAKQGAKLAETVAALRKDFSSAPAEENSKSTVFETFDAGVEGWFPSGEAWRLSTQPGAWRQQGGRVYLEPSGVAHSGTVSHRLRGSLRSPTFVIDSKRVLYRVAGRGRIRLIVEGYTLDRYNALLFKGLSIDVDTGGEFRWQEQSQDLEDYIGHRAYIELVDAGDQWLAIDEIRFSDDPGPTIDRSSFQRALLSGIDTVDSLASAYGRMTTRALDDWQTRSLDPGSKQLLDRLGHQRLIPLPNLLLSQLSQHQELERKIPQPLMQILAIDESTPEEQPVYVRGNHRQLGVEVERRFLTALADEQAAITKGSGRLTLARRLLSERNPLASRVIVNRVWHHLFGRGIVSTPDDFGALGQLPTHPQLLDHLALWFRTDANWSIKKLIGRLVLTSTYRMSSNSIDVAASTIDPSNLLLHSMRSKRLQGEAIRDAILAVSGRLDRRRFGPPIPIHLTDFLQGRGRPRSGPLDGDGRRSVYLSSYRNFMSPMMQAFDSPVPMTTIGRRTVSNVPSQALILLNDPFVQQQSRRWARTLLEETKQNDPRTRIHAAFLRALTRPPSESELELCLEFLGEQAKLHGTRNPDEEVVWADLTHVIFNMKDFVFVH